MFHPHDKEATVPDSVVPDPEFQPRDELADRRAGIKVEEYVGRAEREATALIATASPVTGEKVHPLVTAAFLKGFMLGYGEVLVRLDAIIIANERGGDQ